MEELELKKIWQATLKDIKNHAKVPSFRTWFENSLLEEINGNQATVNFTSNFAISYVKKNFEDLIKNTIAEQIGAPIKVLIFKETKKETRRPKKDFDPNQQTLIDISESIPAVKQVKIPALATLNERYTFETFIVGNKNRLAHAAALAVAKSPGVAYNPLYIYGDVGLGKTHLMQAIGHETYKNDPSKKIIYVSCETFLNEMVNAIQTGSIERFKNKYRNIDVFLVDDIQFIAGKDSTQEEFFHTYNALHQGDKQIVMTSDKVPQEIHNLESRLASRFAAGMIADIQPPDLEMRLAILQRKCLERKKNLEPNLLRIIAETVDSNIRELEGALTTVLSFIEFNNLELNEENIKKALKNLTQGNKNNTKPSLESIKEIICQFYKISLEGIVSARRNKELVYPRQILMFLLKTELQMSFPNIGKEIGGRDHTTAMYGVEKIEKELKKNLDLQEEIKDIKSRFYRI